MIPPTSAAIVTIRRYISIAVLTLSAGTHPIHAQATQQLEVVEESDWRQIAFNPPGLLYSFTLKAILPDGSHALLTCNAADKKCGGVQIDAPEKMPPDSKKCDTSSPPGFTVTTCVTKNLGSYKFRRLHNIITLYSGGRKSEFTVTSSW
jgi:hypothetical protein